MARENPSWSYRRIHGRPIYPRWRTRWVGSAFRTGRRLAPGHTRASNPCRARRHGRGHDGHGVPRRPARRIARHAVVFAVLAVAFFARAGHRRSSAGHRCQNAAIGAGQFAMAYMLAVPAHSPT
ncbi:MAG: DUF5134 domain-containing protein [Catenulispora sp.]